MLSTVFSCVLPCHDADCIPLYRPLVRAVNLPGYMFALNAATGDPGAVPCPADTFGPGLRKQRACPPCPTGFTTVGKTKQTSMNACGESNNAMGKPEQSVCTDLGVP